MILFSICDIPWWLLWLLPLLLGLLAWWLRYNKYNKMVAEYEGKIKGLNGRIGGLEDDLAACKSKRSELEGDLALTKGRMREMENDMKSLKAKADSNRSKGGGSKSFTSGNKGGSADLGAIASSMTSTPKPEPPKPAAPKPEPPKPPTPPPAAAAPKSMFAGVKPDNLQIIEGIGPKMESVLKENGIDRHVTLGNKSVDEIQTILNKYGDKYKIIDPKSWPSQAKLAGNNQFDELIALQKKLDGGKGNAVSETDSKLEKYLIKIGALKAFKQDDLKAIEGIGPATDKLLRENGINTWRELSNTSADRLKAILTAAGSRFALGDPTTWPKQAELAADGKFDELREYQDFLDGGKA